MVEELKSGHKDKLTEIKISQDEELRKTEGLEFLARIPMAINLVGSDGDPIEKLAWGPMENSTTDTQQP